MGTASLQGMHRFLGTTAVVNATLCGVVVFGSVGISITGAQAQTSAAQNSSALPPVTVDAPKSEKKRSPVASTQRAQSSRAVTAAGRARNAAPVQAQSTQAQGSGRTNGATERYIANNSTSGTKTNTPLIETPQSISVVTRKQLDGRAVQSLTEAVGYEPGVRVDAAGFDPRFDSISIRGFDITYNGTYLDGLRLVGAGLGVYKTEPYGADSITVVRGPSSAVYGLGSPGGLIDISSKLPTSVPYYEVQSIVGDRSRYQGNFDLSGPLDRNGEFLYRLTGVVRDADLFVPGGKDNRVSVAPAFT